jgi:hypothetical protein
MSSKRALRRKRCQSKIAHQTEGAAFAHLHAYNNKFGQWLNAYRCHWCGAWHIGHTEENHSNRKQKLTY